MGNDCQLTKLLIFLTKTKLLGTTLGSVQRTEWRICILMVGCKGCNPLTRQSDQLLISPFLITPKLNIKFMRLKEMTTNSPCQRFRKCIKKKFKSVECLFCGSIFLLFHNLVSFL